MPDERAEANAPEATPTDVQPPPSRRQGLLDEPAPIFIAAATLFAILINSSNVGVILMLGVIALLLELRLRPKG